MKLKKVKIVNFRSIKNAEITFEPQCRVLVGINESGKSNLLDALSLLSDDYAPQLGDKREQLPDEIGKYKKPEIYFIFEIADDEDAFYDRVLSRVVGANTAKIVKEGEKGFTVKQYCKLFSEGLFIINIQDEIKYPIYWEMDISKYRLVEGWKKPSPTCPADFEFIDWDNTTHKFGERTIVKSKDKWDIPEEYLTDAKFMDFNNIVRTALLELIKDNLPQVVYWTYSDTKLLPEKINLEEFTANPDMCVPLQNMFHLAGEKEIKDSVDRAKQTGANQLTNLLRRVANQNTQHFQDVWKEYRAIKFSLVMDGDFIKCSVSEKNDFAFQKRSDGFKKFVAFLLTVSTKSHTGDLKNTLVLIDEPDSGLHPSGARYLRDELIKISKKNYVVYSTHSIFMIDHHVINRHLIITKKDEVTTIQEADEGNITKEEVIFNAINYSTFEHLKETNVVLEGWRDRQIFEAATKSYEIAFFKKIGIAHVKGVSSYKYFIPILELAGRKVLIVSDNDNAAKNSQKEYLKLHYKTEWKRYDEISSEITAKTGEDFLKKDYLILKLKEVTKRHGKEIKLEATNIPEDNRLAYIREKIDDAEFASGGTGAEIMNDFKTALFDALSKTKIEDRYTIFLTALKKHLKNNLMNSE